MFTLMLRDYGLIVMKAEGQFWESTPPDWPAGSHRGCWLQNWFKNKKNIKQKKLKSNKICRVRQSPPDWPARSHRCCWLQHWFKIKNQTNQNKQKFKSNSVCRVTQRLVVGVTLCWLQHYFKIQNQKSKKKKLKSNNVCQITQLEVGGGGKTLCWATTLESNRVYWLRISRYLYSRN